MTDLFLGYPDEGIMNWIKENCKTDYSKIPLCFETLEDGYLHLNRQSSTTDAYLLYSLDNETWQDWDYLYGTDLKTGEKLYLKAKYNNGSFSDSSNAFSFSNLKSKVYGNIMSLLYNDFIDKKEIKNQYVFNKLFYQCTSLIDASNLVLPATTLAQFCYNEMFSRCTNLALVPELPATALANYCYLFMFNNCSNITEIHYPKSFENDSTFTSMYGSPQFGATNATVYYDL